MAHSPKDVRRREDHFAQHSPKDVRRKEEHFAQKPLPTHGNTGARASSRLLPVSLLDVEKGGLFPGWVILGLGLVIVPFGFIPDGLLTLPGTHHYPQFSPTSGPGPPDSLLFVSKLAVYRVVKRCVLSRNEAPGGSWVGVYKC